MLFNIYQIWIIQQHCRAKLSTSTTAYEVLHLQDKSSTSEPCLWKWANENIHIQPNNMKNSTVPVSFLPLKKKVREQCSCWRVCQNNIFKHAAILLIYFKHKSASNIPLTWRCGMHYHLIATYILGVSHHAILTCILKLITPTDFYFDLIWMLSAHRMTIISCYQSYTYRY